MNRTRTILCSLALVALAAPAWAGDAPRPLLDVSKKTLELPKDGGTAQLKLTNKGSAPLQISHVRVSEGSDGFTVADLSKTLAAGESAEVTVTYTKSTKREQAFGGLQILTNDETQPDDPRTPETDHITAVALQVNSSLLLTLMVFIPLLGMALVMFVPKDKEHLTKWVALAIAAVPVILGVYLFKNFDNNFSVASGNYGMQFIHHFVWIPSFNIEFYFGVDGLSVTMILLTALVSIVAVGASWGISKNVRAYFAMFLLLEAGMMGVFCACDFFLFYVFWEVMLLPMYFLIGIWGGPRKEYAAIKFFLYTLAGSVLMLLALIALYYNSSPTTLVNGLPAAHSFDLMKLSYVDAARFASPGLSLLGFEFAKIVWIGLFIGFAIKIPMFPFHTWLPDAHVEAPTAISVILAGVLLKMGTYGILRINFGILPTASQWAGTAMAVFGTINILYGAFCAFAQKDLKKLVAYSSVSHMGYCLVGMAAFTQTGFNGALMQMFNHGTITSMLFILVGVLYDRAHTREIDKFGGIATQMPRYAAFFGFAFMASLGLPGLSGFIGEVLVFLGAFPVYRIITILAATGVIFTAAYHLWAMQRIHLGKWNDAVWKDKSHFPDMDTRELLTLLPMAAIVLLLGFYPSPVLNMIGTGMNDLLTHVTGHYGAGSLAMVP
jgi:NADH-quinone oxidoreductase subunit M